MNGKGLISVIVPAYNAGGQLPACLEGLLAQDYPEMEIIVIDDGSQDTTGEMADDYAAQDCRVTVVHKVNGGVSSARNEGMKVARGEWLAFVDADDRVESNYLSGLMLGGEADLIVGGYRTVGDGGIPERDYLDGKFSKTNGIKELLEQHLTEMTFLCPWGKLFRRSLVQKMGLTFDTRLRIGEDALFVWSYLTACETIATVAGQGYIYATEKNDFKYRQDAPQTLATIRALMAPLQKLEGRLGMEIDNPTFFVYNYYIWLYKLYVNRHYTWKERKSFRDFFQTAEIERFFRRYRHRSKDKLLVHGLLKLRMYAVLYLLIKINY